MSDRHPFHDDLTAEFHKHYRAQTNGEGPPWMTWMGVNTLKCPTDLWIYQEIMFELKPEVVIEGGTASGGSALFMANILDTIGKGEVISVDCDRDPGRPRHPRIAYVQGDTLKQSTRTTVERWMVQRRPRMLILDDGHDQHHVHDELVLWTPLLSSGDYLIVEDTNLGGPLWGLDRFLEENPGRFERDSAREKFLLTYNPKGYLRCLA